MDNIIEKEIFRGFVYNTYVNELILIISKLTKRTHNETKNFIIYIVFLMLQPIGDTTDFYRLRVTQMLKNNIYNYLKYIKLDKFTDEITHLCNMALRRGFTFYIDNIEKINNITDSKITKENYTFTVTENGHKNIYLNYYSKYFNIPYKFLIHNGPKFPPVINNYVIASCVRYHYMDLGSTGLATPYEDMGFKTNDSVLEAFACTFNRYFDSYCSIFIDVDKTSLGNFFTIKNIPTEVVVVNPPYEITLMNNSIQKCYQLYKNNSNLTFIFILPNWKDWPELDNLKKESFKHTDFTKYQKKFINYITGKHVHPTDVTFCYYGKERHIDDNGKPIF